MRVALLIDRMQPGRGGAEAALCAFGRHLVSAGAEVHTYGIEGPRDEDEASLAPGEFHNVSSALGVAHKLGTRTRRGQQVPHIHTAWPLGCDKPDNSIARWWQGEMRVWLCSAHTVTP